MKRRTFLAAAAAAALARPAIGGAAKTLIFVPQANLTSLDPVWTTATVTRNFALMVYDMLYGRDEAFVPRPQMVEGHVIDDDGKRWTMKLRDGLLWHDGTPVLARDCLASLQRWMKRDAVGRHDQPAGRCDRGPGRPHAGLAVAQAVSAAAVSSCPRCSRSR